jgi:hypothetical protein
MAAPLTNAELRRILRELTKQQLALEAQADAMEGAFQKQLLRAQARTFERISAIIEDAPRFSDLTRDERLRWWIDHQAELERATDRAGYNSAVRQYVNALPEFSKFTEGMASAQGQKFFELSEGMMKALQQGTQTRFIGLRTAAEQRLNDILFHEVLVGQSKSGSLATLRGAIRGEYKWGQRKGLYAWHATTYARTAHIRVARQISGDQAEAAGIDDNFLYLGPVDEKTRAFCLARVGNVFSRKDITGMSNGQGADVADVFTNGGGWNCRHSWIAVTPGLKGAIERAKGLTKQVTSERPAARVAG